MLDTKADRFGNRRGAGRTAAVPRRVNVARSGWRARFMTGALVALGLACTGSATEPEILDTLVAVAVDGEPLPSTVVALPDYHLELLADTVRFLDGRYAHRRVERFTGFVGEPEIRETGTDGSVRFQGDSITLEPSCDALFCVDVVLVGEGGVYRATWEPLDGVTVIVEYRPLREVAGSGG